MLLTTRVVGLTAALALSLELGCAVGAPTHPKPVVGKAPVVAAASTGPLAALAETPRAIAQVGDASLLSGAVRLLSDHGAGLISNNGGTVVSNNAGSLIGNNGGALISDNASQFHVLQTATAGQETGLTDARIDVLDAAGHYLTDEKKQPLTATSNAQGSYQLKAVLPDETLILRVRLYNGGQLFALLTRTIGSGNRALDLDTASSLGARYVLDKFVNGQQAVLDKLPEAEATALHVALQAARALLADQLPTYQPDSLLQEAAELEGKAPAVAGELDRIKSILLAGQANLGAGLPATDVSLATPASVIGDAHGNLYIAESTSGRIRKVDANGKISLFAGNGTTGERLEYPLVLAFLPDGSLLTTDALANRVRKIAPDGTVTTVAGNGTNAQEAVDQPATQVSLDRPSGLAVGPDGSIYIGERSLAKTNTSRLLRVDPAGILRAVALPTPADPAASQDFISLAFGPDGKLYALDSIQGTIDVRATDGSWSVLPLPKLLFDIDSRLAIDATGNIYIANSVEGTILKIGSDGKSSLVAGIANAPGSSPDGTPALAAHLNTPTGLWVAPSGKLYFADAGNGLVRVIDPGTATQPLLTVAGTESPTQQGSATAISISSPVGLTLDATSHLVIAESTGNTINRLDGNQLTVIAGSIRGPVDDSKGVPELQATFDTPSGVACDGKITWVLDSVNGRLRKIDENGLVTSAAGNIDGTDVQLKQLNNAHSVRISRGTGLVVGPDHMPYFIDNDRQLLFRLRPDGQLEVVAGLVLNADGTNNEQGGYTGDGGPAWQAALRLPTDLAFDPHGDLYITDTGNLVIRKVSGLNGPGTPTISTFAGQPLADTLAALVAGTATADGGVASRSVLIGPAGLVFDSANNLYFSEVGTDRMAALASLDAIDLSNLPHVGARIRRITPDGKISTIAGDGSKVLNDPDNDDTLDTPLGLLIDHDNHLIVADVGTNQLKVLTLGTP